MPVYDPHSALISNSLNLPELGQREETETLETEALNNIVTTTLKLQVFWKNLFLSKYQLKHLSMNHNGKIHKKTIIIMIYKLTVELDFVENIMQLQHD